MKKKNDTKNKQHSAPLLDKEGCPPKVDGVVEKSTFLPIHSLPYLKSFRTELRKNLTPAEAFLWKQLQKAKLDNRKFRRQHSIGNYIVDFYCPSEQLAIELDGEGHYHEAAQPYDEERDLFIAYFNIRVLRFENKQVFDNLEAVLEEIRKCFIE
ncbi:endonuclease domain-containing protein [Flavobacterium sp.]|uniref:endonuclease domain-containing protein n=1 Tax=Flavobacterium sp. TaxID=239 RepID=UPI002FDA06A1